MIFALLNGNLVDGAIARARERVRVKDMVVYAVAVDLSLSNNSLIDSSLKAFQVITSEINGLLTFTLN